jgi:hypothetical protein
MTARIERSDSSDATDRKDPTENADRAEPIDPTESTEPTDPIESTESVLAIDRNERLERHDSRELSMGPPRVGCSTTLPPGRHRRVDVRWPGWTVHLGSGRGRPDP